MSFEKYRILVWKNWTIQKRHYISGIFEVILPVLIVIIFTWIKSTIREDDSSFYTSNFYLGPFSSMPCYTYDSQLSKISYSPRSAWVEQFLKSSFHGFDSTLLEFESFDNSEAMDIFLNTEQPRNVVGIEFDDSLQVIASFFRKL